MKGFATFYIPVSPHVRKFLTAKYSDEYRVSKNDFLGLLLTPFFTKEIKILKKEESVTDSIKSEVYPISISFDFFQRQGCFISHDQLRLIGRTLDKYFREMLFNHVSIYSSMYGVSKKQCIIDFCEMYGISPDDFNPESLYRDFKRKSERFQRINA